jgi:hypothetical protein
MPSKSPSESIQSNPFDRPYSFFLSATFSGAISFPIFFWGRYGATLERPLTLQSLSAFSIYHFYPPLPFSAICVQLLKILFIANMYHKTAYSI